MSLLAAAYFYVDYYAPAIGVNIKERSDAAIQVFRILQILMAILGFHFFVRRSVVVAENPLEALHHVRERSERLLRNILPVSIALRLKSDTDTVIADRHHDVTVVFVDLVDFTPMASRFSAEDLVQFFNRIFSEIDTLVEQHGLEKIETIGDANMVVAGIPDAVADNSGVAAELVLAVIATTQALSKTFVEKVQVRIGMQNGDVVAGVTDIKGKGPMTLHFLTGRI